MHEKVDNHPHRALEYVMNWKNKLTKFAVILNGWAQPTGSTELSKTSTTSMLSIAHLLLSILFDMPVGNFLLLPILSSTPCSCNSSQAQKYQFNTPFRGKTDEQKSNQNLKATTFLVARANTLQILSFNLLPKIVQSCSIRLHFMECIQKSSNLKRKIISYLRCILYSVSIDTINQTKHMWIQQMKQSREMFPIFFFTFCVWCRNLVCWRVMKKYSG